MNPDDQFEQALNGMLASRSRQLDAALEAASRGWHVFPCGTDKQPLTRHGFKDATTDPDEVREFWREYPAASVGVATGASGLIVVDIDCKKGKPGPDEWHRIKSELGTDLEHTTLVETPSGGMHVYYRANGHKVSSTAERIAPGIDTRAEGGYVIAAGSPGYLYVDEHGPETLSAMPEGLYALLSATATPAAPQEGIIPEGRRDATLASLAGTMRRRGLSPEAIYAALAAENKRLCRPPLPDAQVRKIAKSIGKHQPARPIETEAEEEPAKRDRFFVDWSAFWQRDDTDAEWVFKDVLAKGRGHSIYATHKAGKSLLMLYIAAEVATRHEDCIVVYLDYEMTEADLYERLDEMGYGVDSDLSRLRYALLPTLPFLDTQAGADALMATLAGVEAELPGRHVVVVIDTISRAVEGEENSADTFRAFYSHTGIRLKKRGHTWVRLDHGGKSAEQGQRGSSSKGDDVDVVWKLVPMENGVTLKRELSRMSWVPEQVVYRQSDGPLRYVRMAEDWPKGTHDTAVVLDRLKVPLHATFREAREALRSVDEGRRTQVVRAALRWRRMEAADAFRKPGTPPGTPPPEKRSEGHDGTSGTFAESKLEPPREPREPLPSDCTGNPGAHLRGPGGPVDDGIQTSGTADGFDF